MGMGFLFTCVLATVAVVAAMLNGKDIRLVYALIPLFILSAIFCWCVRGLA